MQFPNRNPKIGFLSQHQILDMLSMQLHEVFLQEMLFAYPWCVVVTLVYSCKSLPNLRKRFLLRDVWLSSWTQHLPLPSNQIIHLSMMRCFVFVLHISSYLLYHYGWYGTFLYWLAHHHPGMKLCETVWESSCVRCEISSCLRDVGCLGSCDPLWDR